MITCAECIDRFKSWGDDPRVRCGKYHMSACESYCSKPDYFRQIELPKPEPEIPDLPEVRQLKHQVDQAKAGYLHLQNKLNEHIKNSKTKDRI